MSETFMGARLQSSSPQWRMHKGRCKRHHESIWFESSPRINPKLQSQRKHTRMPELWNHLKVFAADEEAVLLPFDSVCALFLNRVKSIHDDAECSCSPGTGPYWRVMPICFVFGKMSYMILLAKSFSSYSRAKATITGEQVCRANLPREECMNVQHHKNIWSETSPRTNPKFHRRQHHREHGQYCNLRPQG